MRKLDKIAIRQTIFVFIMLTMQSIVIVFSRSLKVKSDCPRASIVEFDNKFIYDKNEEIKIQCLSCNAKHEA